MITRYLYSKHLQQCIQSSFNNKATGHKTLVFKTTATTKSQAICIGNCFSLQVILTNIAETITSSSHSCWEQSVLRTTCSRKLKPKPSTLYSQNLLDNKRFGFQVHHPLHGDRIINMAIAVALQQEEKAVMAWCSKTVHKLKGSFCDPYVKQKASTTHLDSPYELFIDKSFTATDEITKAVTLWTR